MGTATKQTVLVTGAAGFIGFHLSGALLNEGYAVVGYDDLNDYYDPALKLARLEMLQKSDAFSFVKAKLEDKSMLEQTFRDHEITYVVNLAAQAGVRYSIDHPDVYVNSNVVGFLNVLEACRHNNVKHLVYASSSSVYGKNTTMPFTIHKNVNHPVSFYAASLRLLPGNTCLIQIDPAV